MPKIIKTLYLHNIYSNVMNGLQTRNRSSMVFYNLHNVEYLDTGTLQFFHEDLLAACIY